MQVILLQDVIQTGRQGETITVKDGYARNYLLPKGLALEATPGNRKLFEQRRRKIELQNARERDAAAEAATDINGLRIEIAKRVGEAETLYGSVTAAEIEEALHRKGITVDKRRIDLEGGIKTLGEHPVRILLHADVVAELFVDVVAEE